MLSGRSPSLDGYACVGVNYRRTPLSAISMLQEPEPAVASLRYMEEVGADEAVVLQTCNRFEVYIHGRHVDDSLNRLLVALSNKVDGASLEVHRGEDAVRHAFRVASSLDSMMVGEYEVLGQVEDAVRGAEEVGAAGPMMKLLFERAVRVGRRARSETGISRGSVSLPRAAAEEILRRRGATARIVVVGSGKVGSSVAAYLRSSGASDVTILNRTFERAASLASRLGYRALPLSELPKALRRADAVIVATSSPTPIVDAGMAKGGLLIFDLSTPQNVDPSVREVDGVELLTIEDLRAIAEENRLKRLSEAANAEGIVEAEVDRMKEHVKELAAEDLIGSFMERADRIRAAELARAEGLLECDGGSREVLEAMTKAIVNKIAAPLIDSVRRAALDGDIQLMESLRKVLGVESSSASC